MAVEPGSSRPQPASINHRPAWCLACGKWSAVMADGYALTVDGVTPVGRVARCAECGESTIVENP